MRGWLSVLVWAIIIFIGSSIPGEQIPSPVSAASRLLHVAEYAVFGFLVMGALRKNNPGSPRGRVMVAALTIGVLYGVTDEIHQLFTAGRNADSLDVIADAVGSLMGIWARLIWKNKRNLV